VRFTSYDDSMAQASSLATARAVAASTEPPYKSTGAGFPYSSCIASSHSPDEPTAPAIAMTVSAVEA
jgi:hypothetical protein